LSGTITYLGGALPIADADVEGQGSQNLSTQTAAGGAYTLSGLSEASWELRPSKNGDVRDAIDASDALYALEAAVGTRTVSAEQQVACDVTGSGTIGGLDASLILQYAVDLISEVPVASVCGSDWIFFPHPNAGSGQATAPQVTGASCTAGSMSYSPLVGAIGQQDFTGVVLGDCDHSWGSGSGAAAENPGSASLRLGKPRMGRGEMVEMPVYINGNRRVRAADLIVRYDPRYLRAIDVRTLYSARGAMLRYNTTRPGTLRVALARLTSIDAAGKPVLLLRFKIDGRKRSVAVRRAERTRISRQRVD